MIDKADKELAILADFVVRPKASAYYAEHQRVTGETFAKADYGAVWEKLLAAPRDDQVVINKVARDGLGLEGNDLNELLDLQSNTEAELAVRLHELAMADYARKVNAAVAIESATYADCADGEAYVEKIRLAAESVPKPPSLGISREEEAAKSSSYGKLEEMPERLLHVPGFIDQLTEYSLRKAPVPNRTLAFAGALACLAHLAGRLFTDRRDTRCNLYVMALGPSGSGKEMTRGTNAAILHKCNMQDSLFCETSSGEGLEDTLTKYPAALYQMDEIQDVLAAMSGRDSVGALAKAQYLDSLYTSSNSVRKKRTKAGGESGESIYNPCLTILATGISHRVYSALKPALIEKGLLGRCLMFDTMVYGAPNPCEGDPPRMPEAVVNQAQELASRHARMGAGCPVEPTFLRYGEGVANRLNEIFGIIHKRTVACNDEADYIGAALWGRASEKVSKLAIIHTVSGDYSSQVITRGAVEWAWEVTEYLVKRMLARVARWMTHGKADEGASMVMEMLAANKGRLRRHTIARKLRDYDVRELDAVEQLLIDRNQITVTQINKMTKIYSLVKEEK